MQYVIDENIKNFIVDYFSKAINLPVSLEQIQGLLSKIKPLVDDTIKKEVKDVKDKK